jgi:hypothetical protein
MLEFVNSDKDLLDYEVYLSTWKFKRNRRKAIICPHCNEINGLIGNYYHGWTRTDVEEWYGEAND